MKEPSLALLLWEHFRINYKIGRDAHPGQNSLVSAHAGLLACLPRGEHACTGSAGTFWIPRSQFLSPVVWASYPDRQVTYQPDLACAFLPTLPFQARTAPPSFSVLQHPGKLGSFSYACRPSLSLSPTPESTDTHLVSSFRSCRRKHNTAKLVPDQQCPRTPPLFG